MVAVVEIKMWYQWSRGCFRGRKSTPTPSPRLSRAEPSRKAWIKEQTEVAEAAVFRKKHWAEASSAFAGGMVWGPPCSGLSFHFGVWMTSEAPLRPWLSVLSPSAGQELRENHEVWQLPRVS